MKFSLFFLSIVSVVIGGCSSLDTIVRTPEKVFAIQRQDVVVIKPAPKPVIPVMDIVIKQGVTTKQQIMSQLGQPDRYINSRQGDFMSYSSYNNNRVINLTYIEKSGTRFSYVISKESHTKNDITIGINQLNNTVGSIMVH